MYDGRFKIFAILLLLAVIFSLFTIFISSESPPAPSARAAALYLSDTDCFVYTKNSDERLPMASTTKIMTALIALEELSPDEIITPAPEAIGIEGSSIYIEKDETFRALDLIYALMLGSANDAAAALAYRISGGIEEFAGLMNERAKKMGLTDTSFTNPHGLDDKNHYTTAHDLAIIAAHALKNENFKEISSTYKKEIVSSKKKRLLVNHNKLLKSYDGCIGVKTGYTKKSGRSLVSAAERDGLTFISVTINAPDDWRDHKKLLDYGYSLFERRMLCLKGSYSYEIPVLDGMSPTVSVENENDLYKICKVSDGKIDCEVKISQYVTSPVHRGDILGSVVFTKDGEIIATVPLRATNDVNKKKEKHFFSFFIK